nr:hypothetical protein [Tanacetum cinerariifolium]
MMASLFQRNTASTLGSGSLPSNIVANPKGELKAKTTQSGLVLYGPTVLTPPSFINLEEDERVEETLIDLDLSEYTIKVPPPPVKKYKTPSQKDYVLHINITLADALIFMPKYQKMLKAFLSNKEKLQELENTPLNENYIAVILKKLPEKLRYPGKFLISCGFSELKCKALANLGASINLMPLSVWKKFNLFKLISTRMTLELANRAIYTPAGIAGDVFVLVGKFTFAANFVIVDYESNPRVRFILGRPFLRIARALIDVHGEEMILYDGYQPQKESINLINVFNNSSEDFLKDLFSNQPSGNPTFSSHPELTSLKVKNDIFDLEGEIEFLLHQDIDSSLKDSIDQGEKIKESKLLIDELDLPCDFLLPSEYDSFISQDFYRVDALPSTNNKDKVFNLCILSQENPFEIITRVVQDNKLATSNGSLMLEDFDPPFYELPFFKEVPSIPGNLKTHAEGFYPPVFISSASLRNHVSKSNRANVYLMAYLINGLRFT